MVQCVVTLAAASEYEKLKTFSTNSSTISLIGKIEIWKHMMVVVFQTCFINYLCKHLLSFLLFKMLKTIFETCINTFYFKNKKLLFKNIGKKLNGELPS